MQLKNKKRHFIRSTSNITNISSIDGNIPNSNDRNDGNHDFNNDNGDINNEARDENDNDDGDTDKDGDDGVTNDVGDEGSGDFTYRDGGGVRICVRNFLKKIECLFLWGFEYRKKRLNSNYSIG